MTLIVGWLNREEKSHPCIWTAGDSKISNGDSTLTLYGSKILELPVRCKDISTVYQQLYFETKLTFAYAGSSLVGLNVYCALYAIFTNLGGPKYISPLPDYKSIMLKSARIFDYYYRTIQSPTEILISGFCPKTKQAFQGKIYPKNNCNGIIETKIEYTDFTIDSLAFDLLGEHTSEIKESIYTKLKLESIDSLTYWRTPKSVLKELIERQSYQSIGGNIQLAINYQYSFNLYSVCEPIKGDEPNATMKFRNLDVFDDIGSNVGECFVAINAIV